MNIVYLLGNSGSDVELKQTQNGNFLANVSLATSERKKDGNFETTWHRIALFGKTAEMIAPRIKKGTQLFVQGKIHNNEWTDKNGVKQKSTDIFAFTVKVIEKLTQPESAYSQGQDEVPF